MRANNERSLWALILGTIQRKKRRQQIVVYNLEGKQAKDSAARGHVLGKVPEPV